MGVRVPLDIKIEPSITTHQLRNDAKLRHEASKIIKDIVQSDGSDKALRDFEAVTACNRVMEHIAKFVDDGMLW